MVPNPTHELRDLRRLRKRNGLSQQKLAQLAGCREVTSNYSIGYQPGSSAVIVRLRKALEYNEGQAASPASVKSAPDPAREGGEAKA